MRRIPGAAFDEAQPQLPEMITRTTIPTQKFPAATKLELFSLCHNADANLKSLSPRARQLLAKLIDTEAARHWSVERIAAAIGKNVRTIYRAISELKATGVLTVTRRRHATGMKFLNVEAARTILKNGAEAAKEHCKKAIQINRILNVTGLSGSNHFGLERAPEGFRRLLMNREKVTALSSAGVHWPHKTTEKTENRQAEPTETKSYLAIAPTPTAKTSGGSPWSMERMRRILAKRRD